MAQTDADAARLKADFLALIDEGLSEHKARKKLGISEYYLKRWRETDEDFRASLNARQESAIEAMFDRLDEALDIYPNPQQAKVFSDNLKWKLAKLRPDRFGDALNLKTTHTIDLTERFARALARLSAAQLRPQRDPAVSADTPILENVPFQRLIPADTQSARLADTAQRDDSTGEIAGADRRGVAGGGPPAAQANEHVTSPPEMAARGQS